MFEKIRIYGSVFFLKTHSIAILEDSEMEAFIFPERVIPQYQSYCDDFGPMNLGAVHKFCFLVHEKIHTSPSKDIVIYAHDDKAATNACFLLGAYMIMMLDMSAEEVAMRFEPLMAGLLSYCDISPGPRNFALHLQDCWEALRKGKERAWIDFSPDGFDIEEYDHYDDPINGDLHVVVPGKLVAMKGPVDLAGDAQWMDRPGRSRDFSPAHMAEVLKDFEVLVVARLNEAAYDPDDFRAAGIAVFDIPFEDCSTPTEDVVAKFLLLVETAPGAVAVHCKAGLGRTGTLIALHLMKSYGFTARQAIGWLRIVRPGSVIGVQQDYLCATEASIVRMRARPATPLLVPLASSVRPQLSHVESLCARISCRVDAALARSATLPANGYAQHRGAMTARWSSAPCLLGVSPAAASASPPLGYLDHAAAAAAAGRLASHVASAAERRGSDCSGLNRRWPC